MRITVVLVPMLYKLKPEVVSKRNHNKNSLIDGANLTPYFNKLSQKFNRLHDIRPKALNDYIYGRRSGLVYSIQTFSNNVFDENRSVLRLRTKYTT